MICVYNDDDITLNKCVCILYLGANERVHRIQMLLMLDVITSAGWGDISQPFALSAY